MKNLLRSKKTRSPRPLRLVCDENNDEVFHYRTTDDLEKDLRLLLDNLDFLDGLFHALEEGSENEYEQSIGKLRRADLIASIAGGDRISVAATGFSTTRPAIIELVLCAAMLSDQPTSVDIAFRFIDVLIREMFDNSTEDDMRQFLDEVRLAKQEAYAFACAAYKYAPAEHMRVRHDRGGQSLRVTEPPITLASGKSSEWREWVSHLRQCARHLATRANHTTSCAVCGGQRMLDFQRV